MRRILFFILIVILTCNWIVSQSEVNVKHKIFKAIKTGDLIQIEEMVEKGADVNAVDENEAPLIMWAVYKGHLDILKYLVSKGADPKKKGIIWVDKKKKEFLGSPVACAVIKGRLDIIKYLLEECKINVDDHELELDGTETGGTALIGAAYRGKMDIVKYLISKGSNINARDKDGYTAVFSALTAGFEDIAQFLCQNGAIITQKDKNIARSLFFFIEGGNALKNGEYEKAINNFQKTRELNPEFIPLKAKKSVVIQGLGLAHYNLAKELENKYEFENSVEHFKKAYAIFKNDKKKAYGILRKIGAVYGYLEKYEYLIDYYIKTLSIGRDTMDKVTYVSVLNTIGTCYMKLNQIKLAQQWLETAKEYHELVAENQKDKLYNLAQNTTYINLGSIYQKEGKYDEALTVQKKALEIMKRIGDQLGVTLALVAVGQVYTDMNHYGKAIRHFKDALKISKQRKDILGESVILNNIGVAYYRLKNYKKSIIYSNKALEVSKTIKQPISQALDFANIAACYKEIGNLKKSIEYLERSIQIYDNYRFNLESDINKASLFSTYLEQYKLLFMLYYETGDYQKAFKISEKSKSIAFAELMSKREARDRTIVNDPEFQKYSKIENLLRIKIRKLVVDMETQENIELEPLYNKLAILNDELNSLRLGMKKKFSDYYDSIYPDSCSAEKIKNFLKDDETFISYYILDHYTIAFLIDKRQSLKTVKLEVGKEWIDSKISNLREAVISALPMINSFEKKNMRRFSNLISSYARFPEESYELYLKIFQPLQSLITTENVIISADGSMYGFPFEALVNNLPAIFKSVSGKISDELHKLVQKEMIGKSTLFSIYQQVRYLGMNDEYWFSYLPRGSELAVLRKNLSKRKVNGIFAFADPILSTDDVRLNNALKKNPNDLQGDTGIKLMEKLELKRLSESYEESKIFCDQLGDAKIFTGIDANECAIWNNNLEKAKYILFSTHCVSAGNFVETGVSEPALVLTLVNNPVEYDGLLTMSEVLALKLNTDVVILSSCDSAGESGKGGEGFAGMARSFLFAGSQAVVASHWPVEARATKMLIENYGKFLKTKGRLEALDAAREVVKNAVVEYGIKRKINVSYAHPYFWAPFVLLGER